MFSTVPTLHLLLPNPQIERFAFLLDGPPYLALNFGEMILRSTLLVSALLYLIWGSALGSL